MIEKLPENVEADFSITGEVTFPHSTTVSYKRIIKRIWHYGISVLLVFFISLSVYPALTVLIESQYKGKGYIWNDIYFVPVVTYLIFSCGDYTGRILSGIFQWPKKQTMASCDFKFDKNCLHTSFSVLQCTASTSSLCLYS